VLTKGDIVNRTVLFVMVFTVVSACMYAEILHTNAPVIGEITGDTANLSDIGPEGKPGQDEPGDVIEVFANTWAGDSTGLAFDYTRYSIRYAHESSPGATIFDVYYPVPHALLASITLSAENPGWPVTLDDRDGVAYDPITDTHFLPDYNGDLSNRDDNIVEINQTGTILNAWETDGAGNDSSDGSVINTIMDIAVIPGSSRYFVTDYISSVVTEIALLKSGQFVPSTWSTIKAFSVPGIANPVSVDYDSEHDLLYVSDRVSTTIAVLNTHGVLIDTFPCPCTVNYHTGVTYIEGSSPPEIWVTNFGDEETTRCEASPPAFRFDTLYTIRESDNYLVSIDVNTMVYTTIGPTGVANGDFGGLAYDPNHDILYWIPGRFEEDLYVLNQNTGAATLVGNHGISDLFGLAYDSTNDVLYATQFSGGTNLYSLNTGTGMGTLIGDTGEGIGGLAYNGSTDQLVGIHDGSGELYEIDRSTAALTLIHDGDTNNDSGLAYDRYRNIYWDMDWNGDLFFYDIFNGYYRTTVLSGMDPHDGLAYARGVFPDPCDGAYYQNGDPDYANSLACDRRTEAGNLEAWVVDDVILMEPALVTDLHFWAVSEYPYVFGNTGDILILNDSGGSPGSEVAYLMNVAMTRVATGDEIWGRPEYVYTVEGLSIPLPAGTYWFGMRPVNQEVIGQNFNITAPVNGSEVYFRSEIFGYPDWVIGTSVFGTAYDLAFCITGHAIPTPTPVPPTNTPVPPTNTPLPPTNTPIPPTNTPLSPTPTVPTGAPTNTPVPPTDTPVPPTNTPECTILGCEIYMPSDDFGPGDECYCDVTICNPNTETYSDIPVFVILDVYGLYFFAPSFSDFDYYVETVAPGILTIPIIPSFTWPGGVGSASGLLWYAAMTDPGITHLFGDLGMFMFGWHS
jgi:hypothetical protein